MTSTERLADRVTELLQLGHEARGFEVKGPGPAKGQFFGKVTRAALSLGNLRDGGLIVIGVTSNDLRSMGPGLSDADAATWASYDRLSVEFAAYADPPLQFHSELLTLGAGTDHPARVCVIEVDEFPEVPYICKKGLDAQPELVNGKRSKNLDPPLRKSAVYVRSRQLPETTDVASAEQMRELLELATQKALARLLRTTQRAGGIIVPAESSSPPVNQGALFDEEKDGGWQ